MQRLPWRCINCTLEARIIIIDTSPMDRIYHLYLLVCTMQAPIFLFLLSVRGVLFPVQLLLHDDDHRYHNDNDYYYYHRNETLQNTTQQAYVQRGSLSFEMGCACASCTVFASFYMMLTYNGDEEGRFLSTVDHACNDERDVEESGGRCYLLYRSDEARRSVLMLCRCCFWGMVWLQGCMFHAMLVVWTRLDIQKVATLRFGALWCLCRTSPAEKGLVCFLISSCLYLLWMHEAYAAADMAAARVACLLVALDAVLVLGHHYDLQTPILVVLNCRLFYAACSGSLLLVWASYCYY